MSFLDYDNERQIIDFACKTVWDLMAVFVEWNLSERIVVDNDEIKEVAELHFIKLEKDNEALVKVLIEGMAERGFAFIRLDKDVWLGEVRYRLFFEEK